MQNLAYSRSFRASFVCIMCWLLLTHFIQLFTASAIYPVTHYGQGGDFHAFYDRTVEASSGLLEQRKAFYKPPLVALLLFPLTALGFLPALVVVRAVTLLSVCAVVILGCRLARQPFWPTLAILLCVLFSHPLAFLVDRGNVDGVSLSLACLAFFGVSRFPLAAILLFALSVNIKTNTLALFPAFIVSTSLSLSILMALTIIAMLLLVGLMTPAWSLQWLSVAAERAAWATGWRENGSIFRPFLGLPHGDTIGWVILVLTLAVALAALVRRAVRGEIPSPLCRLLLFLPFCQAYPKQSYLYGYIFFPLLLLVYCGSPGRRRRWESIAFLGGCLGVVLSCFPSAFMLNFLRKPTWPFFVPSLGLALILVSNAALLWGSERLPLPEPDAED